MAEYLQLGQSGTSLAQRAALGNGALQNQQFNQQQQLGQQFGQGLSGLGSSVSALGSLFGGGGSNSSTPGAYYGSSDYYGGGYSNPYATTDLSGSSGINLAY
jgi:hypothetical protein